MPVSGTNPASAIVVGADGLVGRALASRLEACGCRVTRTTRRRTVYPKTGVVELDLRNPDAAKLPDAEVAFFCAGLTKMSTCRDDPALADLVNHRGPVALARELARRGTIIVYLSTSAVLDCLSPQMRPDQPRKPRSVYGQTKSLGEASILELDGRVCVARLTKILDPDWALLLDWQSKLRRGVQVVAFNDHTIAPITINHAVESLALLYRGAGGIYQISGAIDVSYYDFALLLAKHKGISPRSIIGLGAANHGIPDEEITPYTSLDCSRLSQLTGFRPPRPDAVLRDLLPVK